MNELPLLIEWRVAERAGLPATVDPQPLIGIFPDVVLKHFIEHASVLQDVFGSIPGFNQIQRRIEVQTMLLKRFIPDQESGNYSGSGS